MRAEKQKVVELRWKLMLVVKLKKQKRKNLLMNTMKEDQKEAIVLDLNGEEEEDSYFLKNKIKTV